MPFDPHSLLLVGNAPEHTDQAKSRHAVPQKILLLGVDRYLRTRTCNLGRLETVLVRESAQGRNSAAAPRGEDVVSQGPIF